MIYRNLFEILRNPDLAFRLICFEVEFVQQPIQQSLLVIYCSASYLGQKPNAVGFWWRTILQPFITIHANSS